MRCYGLWSDGDGAGWPGGGGRSDAASAGSFFRPAAVWGVQGWRAMAVRLAVSVFGDATAVWTRARSQTTPECRTNEEAGG